MARKKLIKMVLIGSNPSNYSSTYTAFHWKTRSGKTLEKWMAILGDLVIFNYEYSSINVSDQKTPNNKPLTRSQIKWSAENELLPKLVSHYHDHVKIAVGKTAEQALTLLDIEHFALPHPSGRNRKLNDPQFIEEKIKSLKEYLRLKYKI